MPGPPDVAAALTLLRLALRAQYGVTAKRVHIDILEDPSCPLTLPFPPDYSHTPPAAQPEAFVPTPFQEEILAALEGKALRTDALAAKVGDRSRLFRPGGLKELQAAGMVSHHPRLGFYRGDCPPEELVSE